VSAGVAVVQELDRELKETKRKLQAMTDMAESSRKDLEINAIIMTVRCNGRET
jgi:hypothetical protein